MRHGAKVNILDGTYYAFPSKCDVSLDVVLAAGELYSVYGVPTRRKPSASRFFERAAARIRNHHGAPLHIIVSASLNVCKPSTFLVSIKFLIFWCIQSQCSSYNLLASKFTRASPSKLDCRVGTSISRACNKSAKVEDLPWFEKLRRGHPIELLSLRKPGNGQQLSENSKSKSVSSQSNVRKFWSDHIHYAQPISGMTCYLDHR
jgi:hypothetical protein